MDKLPYEELEYMVVSARQQVQPGSRWQHYKGSQYVIADIAIVEATNELAVIYTSVEHPAVSFVRPLTVWQQRVEWNGRTIPRFKQID